MKTKAVSLCILILLAALSLAGCRATPQPAPTPTPGASATPSPTPPLPTPTRTPTATRLHPGYEPIQPETVRQLEILSKLGAGQIYDVAISPETQSVAVYTPLKIYRFDALTLSEQGSLAVDPTSDNTVAIAYSPDGKKIAFSSEQSVCFWNLLPAAIEGCFSAEFSDWQIFDLQFSPDGGQMVMTAQGGLDRCDGSAIHYALYDLKGNSLFDRYYCAAYTKQYVHMQAGQLYLVFGTEMSNVFPLESYVVDLESGALLASSVRTLEGYEGAYTEEIHGAKGLLPSSETIRSWTREDQGKSAGDPENLLYQTCELDEENDPGWYEQLLIGEGKGLYANITAYQSVGLSIWNLQTCQMEKQVSYPSAEMLVFSPAGDLFATSDGANITVWELPSGNLRFEVAGVPFHDRIDFLTFNAGGDRLITGPFLQETLNDDPADSDHFISVWDAQQGTKLMEIDPGSKSLYGIAPTPNVDIVLLRDAFSLAFWNIRTGELAARIPTGVYVFGPSGNEIWVSATPQRNVQAIKRFDFMTGEEKQDLGPIPDGGLNLSINQDGSRLGVYVHTPTGDFTESISVFDTRTGEKLWTANGGGSDRYIEIGDSYFYASFESGQHLLTFDPEKAFFSIPDKVVAQNDRIILSYANKTLSFWDAKDGGFLGQIFFYLSMRGIALSPDQYHLVTLGDNGILYVWGVPKP